MISSFLRIVGKAVSTSPSIFKPIISLPNTGLRIIYYHIVGDEKKEYYFSNNRVSVDAFQKQIKFLKSNFEYISLSEAIDKYYAGESLDGFFTITTDDGFRENYTNMAPILIENNLRATFFLVTNCIDNKDLMWRNKLHLFSNRLTIEEQSNAAQACADYFKLNQIQKEENLLQWSSRTWPMKLKDDAADFIWKFAKLDNLDSYLNIHKPYLEKNEIKELIDKGFEIGTHSKSHPYFSKLSLSELNDEILGSIKYIKKKFPHGSLNILSLPFGNRLSNKLELEFLKNNPNQVLSILGIHSALSNYVSPIKWERDLFELDLHLSIGTFTVVPYCRRILMQYA